MVIATSDSYKTSRFGPAWPAIILIVGIVGASVLVSLLAAWAIKSVTAAEAVKMIAPTATKSSVTLDISPFGEAGTSSNEPLTVTVAHTPPGKYVWVVYQGREDGLYFTKEQYPVRIDDGHDSVSFNLDSSLPSRYAVHGQKLATLVFVEVTRATNDYLTKLTTSPDTPVDSNGFRQLPTLGITSDLLKVRLNANLPFGTTD